MSVDDYRDRGEAILRDAHPANDTDPLLVAGEAPEPVIPGVVPDHTRSADEPPSEEPKRKGPLLGANRRRGSGVRALTKSDRERIVGLYVSIGFGVMMVNQPVARTIAEQSEACADAWIDLARENDSVRRALLFVIEGGAWGAVFVAHMPIMLALLPEDFRRTYGLMVPGTRIPDSPEGDGGPQ